MLPSARAGAEGFFTMMAGPAKLLTVFGVAPSRLVAPEIFIGDNAECGRLGLGSGARTFERLELDCLGTGSEFQRILFLCDHGFEARGFSPSLNHRQDCQRPKTHFPTPAIDLIAEDPALVPAVLHAEVQALAIGMHAELSVLYLEICQSHEATHHNPPLVPPLLVGLWLDFNGRH